MVNKVCISIPTKGNMRAATAAWILHETSILIPNVMVDFVITANPLEHARNMQVYRFLKSDCTHLFFLDSDCVPVQDTIKKLLAYDLPIVTGPHESVIKGELGVMILDKVENDKHKYKQHLPIEGFQKVDACGGSGLMVKREVYEKMPSPWFECIYEDGLLVKSEDFDFCEKIIELGYEIWADCNLIQKHLQ